MFITADQIILHCLGDYVLQSDWMANNKRDKFWIASVHALTYALPFLFFRPSWAALAVIVWTHAVIDRYGIARYVVWAKNWIGVSGGTKWITVAGARQSWKVGEYIHVNDKEVKIVGIPEETEILVETPLNYPWNECQRNGYPPDRPHHLTDWLTIIVDNIIHIAINGLALRYL